ncbi:hypothetical protein LTS08_006986 [Lithohypha guttulata]|nr:hypothetical protein LTS08_006986 [Lithohypha guttulata]
MDAQSLPVAPQSTQIFSAGKRQRVNTGVDEGDLKRIKTSPEEPSFYSDNVRRKLAATTRTGQACDRCKERKMKCDPDPIACQPCRQKSLKCYTTDRVSGQSRERGQWDRAENEVGFLKGQLAYYQKKYGPTTQDALSTPYSMLFQSPSCERSSITLDGHRDAGNSPSRSCNLPDPQYVGWPISDGTLYKGPVQGTKADILDWGVMDSGGFECDLMRPPMNDDIDFFNFSTPSVLKTIHQRQKIHKNDLHLPTKAEALAMAETFLTVMWRYYPVVHKGDFIDLVHHLYDDSQQVSLFEEIQVILVFGILKHQNAIRVQAKARLINDSYRYLHYGLGSFPDMMKSSSLAAMQTLALILMQFRNLPKPGHTWHLAQEMLIKCIDLNYHRDPDKIDLSTEQQNPLAKELRKRVFHAIIGVCIATGCRLGQPAPWQFVQWDVPLPMAILDSELSSTGIQAQLSGRCDFWPCIQLSKLLPLYTELHNYVLSVRREPVEYLKIVDLLQNKIDAWREDWDTSIVNEEPDASLTVSTLLIDQWAAEYTLNLHHPSVCPLQTPEVLERNLELCHRAAKKMLGYFHTLSKQYKAVDFTWHSVVAYTLAFGVTLHVYRRRKGSSVSQDQFSNIKNELAGWMSLMAYADLVLKTEKLLYRQFGPLVAQVEDELYEQMMSNARLDVPSSKSLKAINGSMPSTSTTKQQPSPLLHINSTFQEPSTPLNEQQTHFPHHQHYSGFDAASNFPQSQTPLPPVSYHTYNSTPVTSYAPLPTSLAPLLNEAPPSTMQYQYPTISVQDPAMMFSPHLYTDATAVWPMPEE